MKSHVENIRLGFYQLRRQIFISLFSCFSVFSQQPYSIQIDHQSGLPSTVVYNLHQDKKGFMWVASNEGISRYDGFGYVGYKSKNQTSIPGSSINEDRYGRIWYENFDGFLYYLENNELRSLKQNTPTGYVGYGLTNRYLFVIQKKGVDVFDLKTLKLIKTIPVPIEEVEHGITVGDDYYFIVDDMLYKIDEQLNLTASDYFANKKLRVKYLFPLNNQLYVISKFNEEKKIYFFDSKLNFIYDANIPQPEIIQGSNVIDGVLWIHTPKGTHAYQVADKKAKHINHLFSSSSISVVVKDYQKNYWFGTTDNGIHFVPELKDKIYPIDQNALQISESESGYILGMQTGELFYVDYGFNLKNTVTLNTDKLPVSYLYNDRINQNLFVSSKGFYLVQKNLSDRKQYNVALKEIVRVDEKYYAFAASGFCGLLLNPEANTKYQSKWDAAFQKNDDNEFHLISKLKKAIRSKSIDYNPTENKLVVATNIGLFIITPQMEKEIRMKGESFYAEKVFWYDNTIYALDTKGSLYRITDENKFELFVKKPDFYDAEVKLVKKIGDELVIRSRQFIYLYHLKTGKIITTHINIGGRQINDILKRGNELIILTDAGILNLALNADRKKAAPSFLINEITIDNKLINWKNNTVLKYDENNIGIYFSVIEFDGKATPVYYRINQNDWTTISHESKSVQFPSLAPGSYTITFRVGDKISDKVVRFEIKAPFWQKGWFYFLCFLGACAVAFIYFKWRMNLMRNKINLLNEKMELEKSLSKSIQTAVKSQMNPHFFYNALNTIQAYIFTNDKKNANTYLAKFSKLTRTILEMSEKEHVTLGEETEALALYLELEKMRFKENFEYSIYLQNIFDKEMIEFPPMMIQPYVENAVKHGLLHREGEKKLTLVFDLNDSILTVVIDDNGIGRKRSEELNKIKSEKHKSFATQANEKRLEILNRGLQKKVGVVIKDKYDESGIATGTTVVLTIPVNT